MGDTAGYIVIRQFGEVQAGAEMFAFAVEHDGAHRLRQIDEAGVQLGDQRIADRIALRRPGEAYPRDRAVDVDGQQVEPFQHGWRLAVHCSGDEADSYEY